MAELERRHEARPEPGKAHNLPVDAVHDEPKAWASAVGSRGVEQIASSPAGERVPVGRESIVQASGILARQESDVIEMPEETITAGGGGGESDVIEMPPETITAGGGESDVIEMPPETITAGGGDELETE